MTVLDFGKACVFSPVTGVVSLNGETLPNVLVKRRAQWQSERADTAMTDEQGRFVFDALYERSLMKWLPFEFVAHQTISLSYQGQTFLLWEGTKRRPDEHSELDGRPLHLRCDLSHPQQVQTIGEMTIDGICQLD